MKFDKKTLIISAVFTILILFFIFLFVIFNNPTNTNQTPPPAPTDILTTTLQTPIDSNITIDAQLPQVPDKLSIYQAQPYQPVTAQDLASTLNLTPIKGNKNSWISQDGSEQLTVYPSQQQIKYSNRILTTSNTPISIQQAVSAANQFIEQNIGKISLTPNLEQAKYYDYLPEPITTSVNSATLIVIPYTQTINNYPTFFSSQTIQPLEVWVGPDYQIVKTIINPVIQGERKVGTISTISSQELQQDILDRKGAMIEFSTDDFISTNAITQITINEVKLVYRLSDFNQILYPFYQLTGTATLNTSSTAQVTIIHPAIETGYSTQ